MEAWDEIAQWWIDAVRDDPRDADDLLDLLDELVVGTGGVTLDLGCGEGQVMRHLGPPIVGTDASMQLLEHAGRTGPVVHGRLPDLGWVRAGAFDRAIGVGVVELLEDHRVLFEEAASAVSSGGHLVVVMNHPVATAPRAEPLVDPSGEILWRWGRYLSPGRFVQVADEHEIVMFHRPVGEVLDAAAAAGWSLERLIEHGPSARTVARFPEYRGQEEIPALLGCRWIRCVSC